MAPSTRRSPLTTMGPSTVKDVRSDGPTRRWRTAAAAGGRGRERRAAGAAHTDFSPTQREGKPLLLLDATGL